MLRFFEQLIERLPDWAPELLVAAGQTIQLDADELSRSGRDGDRCRPPPPVAVPIAALVRRDLHRGSAATIPRSGHPVSLLDLLRAAERLSVGEPELFLGAAAIGLGMQGGAILSQVFRSGIEAIEQGQREASLSSASRRLRR